MLPKALIAFVLLAITLSCSKKDDAPSETPRTLTPPIVAPSGPATPVTWQNGLAKEGTTTLLFDPKNSGEHPMGGYILEQKDGKFLVELISYPDKPTEPNLVVYRFNADGTADQTYGTEGVIHLSAHGCGDYGHAAALDSEGRLVIASVVRHEEAEKIIVTVQAARWLTTGQLDKSFGEQGLTQVSSELFKSKIQAPNYKQSPENLLISAVPNSSRMMIVFSPEMNQHVALSLDDQGKLAHIIEIPPVALPSRLSAMTAISETKLVAYFDNSYFRDEWKRGYSFTKIDFAAPETKVVASQMIVPWQLVKLFYREGKIYGAGGIALKDTLIVVRFDEDMLVDDSYGDRGIVSRVWEKQPHAHYPLDPVGATLAKDGSIAVIGRGNFRSGTSIMRVTAEGKLDEAFLKDDNGHTPNPENGALGIIALSSGKTLLTGQSATKPDQTALYWW